MNLVKNSFTHRRQSSVLIGVLMRLRCNRIDDSLGAWKECMRALHLHASTGKLDESGWCSRPWCHHLLFANRTLRSSRHHLPAVLGDFYSFSVCRHAELHGCSNRPAVNRLITAIDGSVATASTLGPQSENDARHCRCTKSRDGGTESST